MWTPSLGQEHEETEFENRTNQPNEESGLCLFVNKCYIVKNEMTLGRLLLLAPLLIP
jgi:hypothetical protein